ncbi:MAG TPA: phytanoyl-CoA dioxygenase family protein [Aliidongia sp.]|nr:phytanoyl-CoA dioxygenase family protein [Aliidongia sp.]
MIDASLPPSTATGDLGVMHLKRLWSRHALQRQAGCQVAGQDEFTLDRIALYGLGLGLPESLRAMAEGGSFAAFERWILEVNGAAVDPEAVRRINDAVLRLGGAPGDPALVRPASAPVFGPEDLAHWERHGYVVLHDAVDEPVRAAAEQAIWQSLGAGPDMPECWYGGSHGHSIWLELVHHPALRAVRAAPRIRAAFAQLWGTNDLWATVDRGGFNPPERPGWAFPGPHLHWDTSIALPMPLGLQGILYLTDTAAEQGAFTCVPGFHHRLEDWLGRLPAGAEPRLLDPDLIAAAVPIAGRAGDLVIWHHALPHGSRPNRTDRPRLVQYISMFPTAHRDDRPWR